MKKAAVQLTLLLGGLASGITGGAEPWTARPYVEWELPVVRKILSDSPWVKDVRVNAWWIKGPPVVQFPTTPGCDARFEPDEFNRLPDLEMLSVSIVVFRVSWVSSRTFREATTRREVICGRLEPEEAEQFVEKDENAEHVIHLDSPDMTPLEALDEDALRKSTSLTMKKAGRTVAPSRVELRRAWDRKTLRGLTFHFPVLGEDSQRTIEKEETAVFFELVSGKTRIKAKFQPKTMVRGEELDL